MKFLKSLIITKRFRDIKQYKKKYTKHGARQLILSFEKL